MAVDLLRNRNMRAELGPFDGQVAAEVYIHGENYFITSNTDYVPALPSITTPHEVYIRSDKRFGTDDPTLWPQQFSRVYCHFAAIAKRDARPDLQLMWWDPVPQDFVVGSAITRGLGKLSFPKLAKFTPLFQKLEEKIRSYRATTSTPLPLLSQLSQSMLRAFERLQSLPSTYEKMQFTLTSMQENYLELEALLQYLTVYKPRMDGQLAVPKNTPVNTSCIGAFTSDPVVAQLLFDGRLPFWLVRPTHLFDSENILAAVPLLEPPVYLLQARPPETPLLYSGNSTDEKIAAIHKATLQVAWYRDPFQASSAATEAGPSNEISVPSTRISGVIRSGPAVVRHAPYGDRPPRTSSAKRSGEPRGPAKVDRDTFKPLQAEEMPAYIPAWTTALGTVDRGAPSSSVCRSDQCYLLPEPALLASPQHPDRRQKFLHHWNLLRDAFLYQISQSEYQLLSSQDWRDILEGHVEPRGHKKSRTGKRSRALAQIIGPALTACGIDRLHGFSPPSDSIPRYDLDKARELIWELAETNFRCELLSLDARASHQQRKDAVRMCFAGGQLVGVPLELSKLGLAAPALEERHRYHLRLAKLMLDWTTVCERPSAISISKVQRNTWSTKDMQMLEEAVAHYYTQSFFELFGRAAVLPMRLEHDVSAK